MMPSPVYLDHNATTPLDPAARAAMEPFLGEQFANPSSPYAFARPASRALARAREQVAALVAAEPPRVVFTSGGTESNNLALHAAWSARPERRHLVISAVEHASVRAPAQAWVRRGGTLTVVPVSREGALDMDALRRAVTAQTALVSVMAANNETGICYPIGEAAELAHRAGAWFHSDAVQAAGKLSLAAGACDFLSLCAHKLHGPKGAGALLVPAGLAAEPLLAGGEQEFGWRGGTENVAALAGFGVAAELAAAARPAMAARLRAWHDAFEQAVLDGLPGVLVVGRTQARLPNTSLLLVEGVATEALLARLDLDGYCCSAGSACAAGAPEPSPVLLAQGWDQRGAVLRVSTGRFTPENALENLVPVLLSGVHQLRLTARS